jgi:hypothetical protein
MQDIVDTHSTSSFARSFLVVVFGFCGASLSSLSLVGTWCVKLLPLMLLLWMVLVLWLFSVLLLCWWLLC